MDFNFDFPTFLVLLTLFTFIFWIIDRVRTKKQKSLAHSSHTTLTKEQLKELSVISEEESFSWIKTFAEAFPVVLIVLILRSFVFEPFRIPSGSMLPTLLVGDFIVVNKFNYGLRTPIGNVKFFEIGEPKRGDVIVFKHPTEGVEYIKRVIGIPGDKVEYKNKRIWVNGKVADYQKQDVFLDEGRPHNVFKEVWPKGSAQGDDDYFSHHMMLNGRIYTQHPQQWVVPEGQYFCLGDNRDNSKDSRYWGFVPEDKIIGRAFGIWMSWNSDASSWFPVNWKRIGRAIH